MICEALPRQRKRTRKVRAFISPTCFERLVFEAQVRGMTAEMLVRELLEHILRDDLIEAVLDDTRALDFDRHEEVSA